MEVIKKAYDDLIAKTAVERQAEEARLAEELKTARMETAKEEINTLKNELTVLQEDVSQTESLLQIAGVNRDRIGSTITSLASTRSDLREALDSLNELDQTIQNNFFGTWTLTDEEKFKLGRLEYTIFGEISDKLSEKESRIAGKEILNQKIQQASNDIETAGEQLSTICDEIIELKAAVSSKKEILGERQGSFETLVIDYKAQGLLPPEEIVQPEEPILAAEINPKTISELLVRPLNLPKILDTQNIDSSPLFNKKILFTSICNEDDFYRNSFCPALKSACLILTPNLAAAEELYSKWEKQVKELAALWKASGSQDQEIDLISFVSPFTLIEKLDQFNKIMMAINYKGLKLNNLITNLCREEFPNNLNLELQIPLSEAVSLLDQFRTEPTDLSPLFSDPTYKNWPKELQYLTAGLTLKFDTNLSTLESDPEFRQMSLGILKQSVNMSPPYLATAFGRLAIGNSWLFDTGIGALAKLAGSMLTPNSETKELEQLLNYVPDREKFQKTIEFSKTEGRKKFDKARIAATSSIFEDIVEGILAKHTTKDSEIGKRGKEFNIQKLILTSLNKTNVMKESALAMKDYLEELEKPVQNPEELKKKKARVEAAKGVTIANTLDLYRSLSEIVARSENVQTLLHAIDEKVLPEVLENPLDLEETPMHEWLQHRVLSHLQHFGS